MRTVRALGLAAATAVGVCLLGAATAWGQEDARGPATGVPAAAAAGGTRTAEGSQDLKKLAAERRRFQDQELTTGRAFAWICNVGDRPRVVWRDAEEVGRLGGGPGLRVRWFDGELNERPAPDRPGRWVAWCESTAPNGTPVRRSLTFFARPPGFFLYFPGGEVTVGAQRQPGPLVPEDVWRAHQGEVDALAKDAVFRAINDSQAGAALLAGMWEDREHGGTPAARETAAARAEAHHLAVKMKVLGLEGRPLGRPRERAGGPAPEIREGTAAEAGVRPGAKEAIDAVCRAWAEDTGEPFVTLVARRGVVVTHEAFGKDAGGKPITREYRCDVASITKTATAVLFARFLDEGRVKLDDPVSVAFPDWPKDDPRVPTFRQCLTHMSGLGGHGDWGGAANANFENVVLNGIDANEPGTAYVYSGNNFDLVAKAMEVISGKPWRRLFAEDVAGPLGMGRVPLSGAGSGAQFTAGELAAIAQWFANRGSYGRWELVRPEVFETLLPEPLAKRYPGVTEEVEGIGNHWMKTTRPGATPGSAKAEDNILSLRTLGHGSLTGCVLLVDCDRDLVVVQARRAHGPRHGEWFAKFLQAVVEQVD